jgi:hypothetical protein
LLIREGDRSTQEDNNTEGGKIKAAGIAGRRALDDTSARDLDPTRSEQDAFDGRMMGLRFIERTGGGCFLRGWRGMFPRGSGIGSSRWNAGLTSSAAR